MGEGQTDRDALAGGNVIAHGDISQSVIVTGDGSTATLPATRTVRAFWER